MEILATTPATPRAVEIRKTAEKMEAAFLAEMLKGVGLDAMDGSFGGGIGEGQFASMMREEQAKLMVEAGGIGLAEHLVRAMGEAENA